MVHPCLAEARHDFVRAQRARIREGLRVDTTNGESRTQPTLKHWRAPSPRFSMGFPHGQVVPPAVGWRSSAQCGACVCHILCHIFLALLPCVVMFSVCETFCSALRVAAAEAAVSLFDLLPLPPTSVTPCHMTPRPSAPQARACGFPTWASGVSRWWALFFGNSAIFYKPTAVSARATRAHKQAGRQ